jgi:hypothetical protein
MKTFLRKLLGVHNLESHVLRQSAEISKLQEELSSLTRRHNKLTSQGITYALQQRAKEAAETVTYAGFDGPLELGNILTGGDPLEELRFKPCDGPLPYTRTPFAQALADTFGNTITDRAVASLKVADPLPAAHTAVEVQAARNVRYSTLAASECAALHVPYSHAEWRSVRDHYDNHSPSWFCPDLVTLGQVRNRALLLADFENLELKMVKNAKRTFVNSYPAPLLIRAQFDLHNEAVTKQAIKEQE